MSREGLGGAKRVRRWRRRWELVMVDGFGHVSMRSGGRVDGAVCEGVASEILELWRSCGRIEGRRFVVVVVLLVLIVSVPSSSPSSLLSSTFVPLMRSVRPVVIGASGDGRLLVHSSYDLAVKIIELGRRSEERRSGEEEGGAREGTRESELQAQQRNDPTTRERRDTNLAGVLL